MKRFIANVISIVLHPLLMPAYGVGLFYFYTYLFIFMPLWKGYLLGLVFLLTGLVPALSVIALHKLK
ncbi:MAG: hypothetical protein ACRCXV_04930, partial [Bacteroidales bacterium]